MTQSCATDVCALIEGRKLSRFQLRDDLCVGVGVFKQTIVAGYV